MKRLTKIVTLCLVLALLSGIMLTGCTSSPAASTQPASAATTEAPTTAPTTAAVETATQASLEPATLTYWLIGPGKQKDSDLVWDAFNKQLQEQIPNTTVDFMIIAPSEYADKWARAMAAQEQVDIAWTGWMINIADEAKKGSLMPLDDLLAQYGQDLVSSLGQSIIDIHRQNDGNIYQIPCWQGMVGNRAGIYFPTELSDLMGSTFIADYQQLMYDNWKKASASAAKPVYDMMETYLKMTMENGKLAKGYNPHTLYTWYLLNGVVRVTNTGNSTSTGALAYVEYGDNTFTVKSMQESDFVKLNYQYMADWFTMGYIRSDIASIETVSGGDDEWRVDKTWTNSWNVAAHNAFTDSISKELTATDGFDISVAFMAPNCEFTLGTATGTSIPTTSKNPERAMMLMNLLVSSMGVDAYQTFVYGIEGTHWTDNGDGTATTLDGDGQATSDWAYGNWKWVIGNCMNSLVTQTDTKGYYEELKALESTAVVNPMLSFSFDNTPVESIKAQLDAIIGEYGQILYRGYLGSDAWEATYDEFIQKMKTAGLDEYIAEVQNQLNEYVQERDAKW